MIFIYLKQLFLNTHYTCVFLANQQKQSYYLNSRRTTTYTQNKFHKYNLIVLIYRIELLIVKENATLNVELSN